LIILDIPFKLREVYNLFKMGDVLPMKLIVSAPLMWGFTVIVNVYDFLGLSPQELNARFDALMKTHLKQFFKLHNLMDLHDMVDKYQFVSHGGVDGLNKCFQTILHNGTEMQEIYICDHEFKPIQHFSPSTHPGPRRETVLHNFLEDESYMPSQVMTYENPRNRLDEMQGMTNMENMISRAQTNPMFNQGRDWCQYRHMNGINPTDEWSNFPGPENMSISDDGFDIEDEQSYGDEFDEEAEEVVEGDEENTCPNHDTNFGSEPDSGFSSSLP
jgi:hypothetical protein